MVLHRGCDREREIEIERERARVRERERENREREIGGLTESEIDEDAVTGN